MPATYTDKEWTVIRRAFEAGDIGVLADALDAGTDHLAGGDLGFYRDILESPRGHSPAARDEAADFVETYEALCAVEKMLTAKRRAAIAASKPALAAAE